MCDTDNQRLKIAVQKSGRLADASLDILKTCGVKFHRTKDQLYCRSKNFPIDIYFLRDDDIPSFVATNSCQIGIVGENVLLEKQYIEQQADYQSLSILLKLGFGRCRLSIAVPRGTEYTAPQWLNGKTIATSYDGVLQRYLDDNNIKAKIINMQGAVEIAPRIGTSDAICDLVSTGTTLTMNGLVEKDIVLQSESVLIQNRQLTQTQNEILDCLLTRMKGVIRAKSSKYIMLHAPKANLDDIIARLPGSEDPTVLKLSSDDNVVAIHAVCDEEVFWETMESLKAAGASSILVLPIEKMLD
jgi:ATP phosphoribosyltransferase